MRSTLAHLCPLVVTTLLGASAHLAAAEPQPTKLGVNSDTEATVLAELQETLIPKIHELQADPSCGIMAEGDVRRLMPRWRPEDEPAELYLGPLAFSVPCGLLDDTAAEPSVRSSDLVVISTSDDCILSIGVAYKQFIAPSLADLAEDLEKLTPGTTVPDALKADLATRFRFENDFAVFKKLHTTPLHNIDPSRLGANELVELRSLLELKRIATLMEAENGVRLFDRGSIGVVANGSFRAGRRVHWMVFAGDWSLPITQAARRDADPQTRSCDESIIRNVAASVRLHADPAPGETMLRLARELLGSAAGKQKRNLARNALVVALRYADTWQRARVLLQVNPPEEESNREVLDEILAKLDAGLCLRCGEAEVVHNEDNARCDSFVNGRITAERAKGEAVHPQQDDSSN